MTSFSPLTRRMRPVPRLVARRAVSFMVATGLLTGATSAAATGPSYASIEITPLAVNEDSVIAFKTRSQINKSGAATVAGTEYGWLLASADGLWEERLHASAEDDDIMSGRYTALETEFKSRSDLWDPPPELRELLRGLPPSEWAPLDPEEGAGRARWSEGDVCLDGNCRAAPHPPRSLHGLVGDVGFGTPTKSLFYHSGIAIFESVSDFELPEEQGAIFHIENIIEGQDVGLDSLRIQAIVLLGNPKETAGQHSSEREKNMCLGPGPETREKPGRGGDPLPGG